MKERRLSILWAMLVLVTVLAAGPNFAASCKYQHTATSDSYCDVTNDEACDGEGTAGPNGGPTTCVWAAGQPGGGLAGCLSDQLCGDDADGDGLANDVLVSEEDGMTTMNFSLGESPGCTSPGTTPGPQEEIFSFCLRELGDAIGYAQLEVEQPNLVAKIHKFVENPNRTGEIAIEINGDRVVVDVGPAMQNVGKLNGMVCAALGRTFPRAACLDDFFVVYADSLGETPTLLSLATAYGDTSVVYSGVSTTEIALEPHGTDVDVTACSEPGEPMPLISVPR